MKVSLSIRQKVIYILHLKAPAFLSLKEIQQAYEQHYKKPISPQTIVAAIDENQFINGNILERTERRGIKRVPVKTFSITFNN